MTTDGAAAQRGEQETVVKRFARPFSGPTHGDEEARRAPSEGRPGHSLDDIAVTSPEAAAEQAPSTAAAPIQRWPDWLGGSGSKKKEEQPLLSKSTGSYKPPTYVPPQSSYKPPVYKPPPKEELPLFSGLDVLPQTSSPKVPKLAPPPKGRGPKLSPKELARQQDKEKLRGMFDVNDDLIRFDEDKPNTVTSKELDELSKIYSDIREGTGNITFGNKSRTGGSTIEDNKMTSKEFETFKGKGLDDIAKILQTPQGRTVLKSLAGGGKSGTGKVTIGGVSNPMLAGQKALDSTLASNGTGSGSEVYYGAGTDVELPLGSEKLKTTSDTALFHELVHAHHAGQGTMIPLSEKFDSIDALLGKTTTDRDIGVRKEEYATVGLGEHAMNTETENAYRESHRTLAGTDQTLKDKYKRRGSYL